MPRTVRIRRDTFGAGLLALLAAIGTTGAVLAGPASAAVPPAAAPAAATALPPTTSTSTCWVATTRPIETTWPAGQVATTYDFENGLGYGVTADGGASIAVTPDAAATGTDGLRVDGLTSGATVSFAAGSGYHWGWYKITARIRVHAPATPTDVVLRPVPTSGGQAVSGSAHITPDGWAVVTAYYVPGTGSTSYCGGVTAVYPTQTPVVLALTSACGAADVPTSIDVDDVSAATAYASAGSPSGLGTTPASPPPAQSCGTPPPPLPTCQARYTVTGEWSGGAVASVEIRNLSAAALPHWTVSWTYPDDQRAVTVWGADSWTQSGRTVTARAPSWAPLPASGRVTLGLVAALPPGTAHAAAPTAVTLDGMACTL